MESRTQFYNQILRNMDQQDIAYSLLLALKHKYYRVYIHSLNVAYGSYYLAKKIDLPEDECKVIALGALFHDIGKINISPKILYKPGRLSDKEWQIMCQHPQQGVDLLLSSKYINHLNDIILYHHERYDGKGYMNGLKECGIPMHARIVSICDAFDAMIAYRSYKQTLSLEQAQIELRMNRYKQFDGLCVDKFIEISRDMYECFREHDSFLENDVKAEDVQSIPSWLEIGDQLENLGIMLLDRHENIYYCNQYSAQSRKTNKHEIIGKSFYSLHKPHRTQIIKEKFREMHSGARSGWSRLMALQGSYIENKYISIKDKDQQHAGTLLITTDVTENETVLRSMGKSIEKLNVLIQAGKLLADVDNLEQMMSYMNLLVEKLWSLQNICLIFSNYKDQHNVIISGRNNYNRHKLNQIFATYTKNKLCDVRYIIMNDKIVIRRLMCFKNNNSCMLEIILNKDISFSEYDQQLMEGIINYLYIAIEKHLMFIDLAEMAIRDQMTGLYNRHYLEVVKENIPMENNPVSFIVGDINNLKYYNDKYGHATGDDLICKTAEFIKESVRSNDLIFRTGGDEFLLILPDCDAVHAQNVIRRIRIKANEWNETNNDIQVYISLGYVVSKKNIKIDRLISIADNNMYNDKKMCKEQLLCDARF